MTPRTIVSLILLSLIFPAQEFWQLWKNDDRVVNWWIALSYPLSIQWFFKMLGIHISELLKAVVIYRITNKIQALRMAAVVLLIFTVVDLIMFFVAFNKAPYALIYSTTAMVSMLVIGWRVVKRMISFKHHVHHQLN